MRAAANIKQSSERIKKALLKEDYFFHVFIMSHCRWQTTFPSWPASAQTCGPSPCAPSMDRGTAEMLNGRCCFACSPACTMIRITYVEVSYT